MHCLPVAVIVHDVMVCVMWYSGMMWYGIVCGSVVCGDIGRVMSIVVMTMMIAA